MYHRVLYLEQETKYGYQNRYNGDPLAHAPCILHLEERPGLDVHGLLAGAVVISRCGSSSPRHPDGAPDCVRPALRLVVGAPLPLAGQSLRSVLWNTFLASAAVRILFVAYIGRREWAAVRLGMSLGPAGQHR